MPIPQERGQIIPMDLMIRAAANVTKMVVEDLDIPDPTDEQAEAILKKEGPDDKVPT